MATLASLVSAAPLDSFNDICEASRASSIQDLEAGLPDASPVYPLPDPIEEMCTMAWDTLYSYVTQPVRIPPPDEIWMLNNVFVEGLFYL